MQPSAAAGTAENANATPAAVKTNQEDVRMKIAVTYENQEVFQHFGHCEAFKIYEIADNAVVSSEVVGTGGDGHEALAGFLRRHGVDTLICGGIGGGARMALAQAGIELYPGVTGDHSCHGNGHTCGGHM